MRSITIAAILCVYTGGVTLAEDLATTGLEVKTAKLVSHDLVGVVARLDAVENKLALFEERLAALEGKDLVPAPKAPPVVETVRVRKSRMDLIDMHDRLHGSDTPGKRDWTNPGDIFEHLRTTHRRPLAELTTTMTRKVGETAPFMLAASTEPVYATRGQSFTRSGKRRGIFGFFGRIFGGRKNRSSAGEYYGDDVISASDDAFEAVTAPIRTRARRVVRGNCPGGYCPL